MSRQYNITAVAARRPVSLFILLLLFLSGVLTGSGIAKGQELNCQVKVIHSQVQGTDKEIFASLETAVSDFMNKTEWTEMQFKPEDVIQRYFSVLTHTTTK